MHLKIYLDKETSYSKEICEELYKTGFLVDFVFLNNYLPKEKLDFFRSNQFKKSDEFAQMFFCSPENIVKDFNSSFSISFIASEDFPIVNDISTLKLMDLIIVPSGCIKTNLINLGIEESRIKQINYYYKKAKYAKRDSGEFCFLFNYDEKKTHWKEFLYSYCQAFENNKEVHLLMVSDETADSMKQTVKDFMLMNNFHFSKYNIIFNNNSVSKALKFSDCYCSFYKNNYFDENLLTSLHSSVPVVVLNSDIYNDYCKKNICLMVDSNKNEVVLESVIQNLKFIFENKNIVVTKAQSARKFVEKYFSKEKFYENLTSELSKMGIEKKSSLFYKNPEFVVL